MAMHEPTANPSALGPEARFAPRAPGGQRPEGAGPADAGIGVQTRLAGVGRRAAAIVIDGLIFVPLLVFLFVRFGTDTTQVWTSDSGATRVERNWSLEGPPFFFFLAAWLVYFTVMEAWRGATVGKLILGLRVAMADGAPLTVRAAIIRNVLRVVDGLFFYLVGAIFAWTSPLRQRLGDRAAGTIVHRRD